ncbi:MAG: STAS domain-containing protein [Spirochaetes bacterium]|nr:STAS domain-containing protein [Spirochaetota bacterium]
MDIIELNEKETYVIIKILSDDFALHEVTKVSSKTMAQLQRLKYPRTIVDLHDVQYIDTSGIGFLANTKNLLKNNGSELIIVCENDNILDIMRIIKLNTFVKIFATLEAAEQYFTHN